MRVEGWGRGGRGGFSAVVVFGGSARAGHFSHAGRERERSARVDRAEGDSRTCQTFITRANLKDEGGHNDQRGPGRQSDRGRYVEHCPARA